MKAITALKSLAVAINKVAGDYGEATVLDEDNGFDRPTLCFEGLYDWTMIFCGSSIFSGELGTYSKPVEPIIGKAIEKAEATGLFFEPLNGCQVVAVVD